MKKQLDFDINMITVIKDDHVFMAKFYGLPVTKIIYDSKGLIFPDKIAFGKALHKKDGKVAEYIYKEYQQIEQELEQLDLF